MAGVAKLQRSICCWVRWRLSLCGFWSVDGSIFLDSQPDELSFVAALGKIVRHFIPSCSSSEFLRVTGFLHPDLFRHQLYLPLIKAAPSLNQIVTGLLSTCL